MAYDPFGLAALAKRLGHKLAGVCVLHDDPFYLNDARERNALWFTALWKAHGRRGLHVHGFHYVLVILGEGAISLPVALTQAKDTAPTAVYQNTVAADEFLAEACRDARYMRLIPAGEIVDKRNDEALVALLIEASDPEVLWIGGVATREAPAVGFTVPALVVAPPVIQQPYLLILWAEKSSVAEVLGSLKEEYGVTVVIGGGDISLTRCEDLVRQAVEDGRPVRILCISDFDPGGYNMPAALARKIEFDLRTDHPDIDLQVRAVALTFDQCVELRLPESPVKAGDPKAEAFTARWGRKATELDALETLHPGVLRTILVKEIERYFDVDLADNITTAEEELQAKLDEHSASVAEEFTDEIAALHVEEKKTLAVVKAFDKKAKALEKVICAKLNEDAPDVNDVDWPEPFDGDDGDEDDDPLFDSNRDYEEQIDRYKTHQGKEDTVDNGRERPQLNEYECICIGDPPDNPGCGKTFTSVRRTAKYCNSPCRKDRHAARKARQAADREAADV